MSASTIPTVCPLAASATARFVVTLLFPTPPLPEEINNTRVVESFAAKGTARPSACPCAWLLPAVAPGVPFSMVRTFCRCSSVITPKLMLTPAPLTSGVKAFVTRFVISLRIGHPATVKVIVRDTPWLETAMSCTMSRSTIERCNSGSSTGRRASITWSIVAVGMGTPMDGGFCTTAIGTIPACPT